MKQDKFKRREKKRSDRKTYSGSSGKSVFLLQEILIRRAERIAKTKKDNKAEAE